MRSSIAKIAIAAAVVLAALGAWSLWSGTESGVALADVLVKVEQVQAFMYKITMHVKGQMPGTTGPDTNMNGSILIANEYGNADGRQHGRHEHRADHGAADVHTAREER